SKLGETREASIAIPREPIWITLAGIAPESFEIRPGLLLYREIDDGTHRHPAFVAPTKPGVRDGRFEPVILDSRFGGNDGEGIGYVVFMAPGLGCVFDQAVTAALKLEG